MPEIIQNALGKIRQLKGTDEGLLISDMGEEMSTTKLLVLLVEAVKELDDTRRGAPKVSGSLSHKPDNFSISEVAC